MFEIYDRGTEKMYERHETAMTNDAYFAIYFCSCDGHSYDARGLGVKGSTYSINRRLIVVGVMRVSWWKLA